MTSEDYWKGFSGDFDAAVREELFRGALLAYPSSFELAQSFTAATGDWVQPFHRHAYLRDTMVAVGERVPGTSVTVKPTEPATTTYVEMARGVSILTFASSVASKTDMPRWAKHRANKSAAFNYDLFSESEEAVSGVYGILLCGPEVNFGAISHAPAFINIGIPASDYDYYIWTHSLFDEFPNVVAEVLGSTPAEIEAAYLEMRRRRAEGGQAG